MPAGGIGVAVHLDYRFGQFTRRAAVLGYTQVTLRGEPAIEHYFALAGMLATTEGAEVEKVGDHWFLDLVGLLTQENDHSRVCLVHPGVEVSCHRASSLGRASVTRLHRHAPTIGRAPLGTPGS